MSGAEWFLAAATLAVASSLAGASDERTVFDFSGRDRPWGNIDDTVMGGRSWSRMRVDGGIAVFTGNVSLENNGGFASVRSRPDDLDLTGHRGLALRVRGDGRLYGLRVRTDRGFDGVSYQAPLEAGDGSWVERRIPFDDFRPVFRGRPVPGYPALDPGEIKSMGLIIARGQQGDFRLELDWIKAYAGP